MFIPEKNSDKVGIEYQRTTFLNLTPRFILRICILGKSIVFVLLAAFFHLYGGQEHYMKFGPQPDFKILGIFVDTWPKYNFVVFMVIWINAISVIVKEVGNPIFKFFVYNPEMKDIYGISRFELHAFTNILQGMDLCIEMFTLIFMISKFDIILISVIVRTVIPIYTVHNLLNSKTFHDD